MATPDEFSRSLEHLAERVRVPETEPSSLEQEVSPEQSQAELQRIREELALLYDKEQPVASLSSPTPEVASDHLSLVPEAYKGQVSELVTQAVSGGILSAVAAAQKTRDPYLIDLFHDALSSFLHAKMRDASLL